MRAKTFIRKFTVGVFVFILTFANSCSVVVKDKETGEGVLKVNCPSVVNTTAYYCPGERATSSLFQAKSRIRVVNLRNGKSITIAVFRDEGVKGVCLPERYKSLLGEAPFPAKVEVLRCGYEDIRTCPSVIRGLASWYGEPYHGRESAYGITYNMHGFYAASKNLPLGTLLRVKNLKNHKEVEVKVIDRGPFKEGRVLDLSYGAAKALDMLKEGTVPIEARVIRCGD